MIYQKVLVLRRNISVLNWMMLGYVIVDLDELTLFLAVVSCDTFLHSHLFPGNRSQLGRMLTYCTSLPPPTPWLWQWWWLCGWSPTPSLVDVSKGNWCWWSDQYHPTKDPYVNQSQLRLVLTSLRKWPLTQRKLHRKLLQHTLTQILLRRHIWRHTVEKSQTNASNVTMHLSQ